MPHGGLETTKQMKKLEDEIRSTNALEKSRSTAKALAVTARKLRFSTSNRSALYHVVGLRPRPIDRIFTYLRVISTICLLIIPPVIATIYYGLIASDQYQSEARFTVRTSTPALGKDQLGRVSGLPSAKVVQDTQIVTNFISSRAILEGLEQQLDIRGAYQGQDADWFARLHKDATYEEFLEYWKKMATPSVSPTSGIITVKVRAFSAVDAQRILQAVVSLSEKTINDLNDRIWRDVILTAEENLKRATQNLQNVRERVLAQQNKSGVLTVEGSSEILASLLASVRSEKLALDQAYAVKLESISKDTPHMRVLMREIEAKEAQIKELQQQIAGSAGAGKNLADVSLDFERLQFERQLAEQQFASSIRTFEQVQFISKQQLMYLDSFLAPSLPDEAQYPQRLFWILSVTVTSVATWAISLGVLALVRNRMN